MTKEQIYDAEIAPALMALAKQCEAAGLSICAVVGWDNDGTGRTSTIQPDAGISVRMTDLAARARGNADALFLALKRLADKVGHNSVVLHLMGSPPTVSGPLTTDESEGVHLIAAERARHSTDEGWTAEHDDQHTGREMAGAAYCYLRLYLRRMTKAALSLHWPWDMRWWKPAGGEERMLVKAGALIAAEIDRLKRASTTDGGKR